MSDVRAPIFDAVRAAAPKGVFSDPGNVLALDNLLDAFGVPREAEKVLAHHAMADAPAFYDRIRKVTGGLDQVQVDTINDLLAAAAHWPVGVLAYGLATAWHEARLTPIAEWGHGEGRPYANVGKYGQAQYGRGLVQLTWDRNYEWADKALGLDGALLKNFDLALDPAIATRILVKGMETGAFTTKKLADYLVDRGTHDAFVRCRRIINGTDRAELVATIADQFQDALSIGGWT